ncbi:TIGR02444 family protein [Aliiglaciecola sp. 2_MG-2023]|uniref:TIGR02444 family protein n=1 Tax=unclassified Aliiglaciecola TaxID=2593648 RepID=UPI0026E1264D|nr:MULTISPECIES: TIGR02444 family protein [unclassified Aliiglaciecola]MDO6711095.1 TIGR02444 family protein [Aliiglaciecola sp. 2_MG-2023]MDO6752009.1 TIGR02444 family protein [Aliiglaciecola sp. 1_MG-2023]
MNNNWLAEDFWQFSLLHYAKSEVKRLTLHLQNEYSMNVNLLLICAYLDTHNRQVSSSQFVELSEFIAPSVAQVETIRRLRIDAKTNKPNTYAKLLEQELEAEKQQQTLIISFCNQHNLDAKRKSNFYHYLDSLESLDTADLKCIVEQLAATISSNQTNLEI